MIATCKCKSGHTWITKVIADEPDVNAITVEETNCPECGTDIMEVIDTNDDSD